MWFVVTSSTPAPPLTSLDAPPRSEKHFFFFSSYLFELYYRFDIFFQGGIERHCHRADSFSFTLFKIPVLSFRFVDLRMIICGCIFSVASLSSCWFTSYFTHNEMGQKLSELHDNSLRIDRIQGQIFRRKEYLHIFQTLCFIYYDSKEHGDNMLTLFIFTNQYLHQISVWFCCSSLSCSYWDETIWVWKEEEWSLTLRVT